MTQLVVVVPRQRQRQRQWNVVVVLVLLLGTRTHQAVSLITNNIIPLTTFVHFTERYVTN